MTTDGPDILLTRPKAQSLQFATDLRARFGEDISVIISPMLEIVPIEVPLDLKDTHTLIFTSVNGVSAYVRQQGRRDLPCLCVGARTANVARGFGMAARSAQGNADDLVAMVQKVKPAPQGHYLYIRGRHAARDIAEVLNKGGTRTKSAALYDQEKRPLSDAARQVLRGLTPVILPLFSAHSAAGFVQQTTAETLEHVTAVCISKAVASQLDGSRFARVKIASAPNGAAMLEALAAII